MLVISICKEKLHEPEFVKPVIKILEENNIKHNVKHYTDLTKGDIHAEKIIICGTSLRDNAYLDDKKAFAWLAERTKSSLGICGGMQLMMLLHGGKLKKELEIGLQRITITNFLEANGEKEIYSLHQYAVESDEFEVLAKTAVPQAVKHKTKPFFGTLFHPEVRNKEIILTFAQDNIFKETSPKLYS